MCVYFEHETQTDRLVRNRMPAKFLTATINRVHTDTDVGMHDHRTDTQYAKRTHLRRRMYTRACVGPFVWRQRMCMEIAELCYSKNWREQHEVGSILKTTSIQHNVGISVGTWRNIFFLLIFTRSSIVQNVWGIISGIFIRRHCATSLSFPCRTAEHQCCCHMEWGEERTRTIHVQTRTPKVNAKKQARMLYLLWYQRDQSQKSISAKANGLTHFCLRSFSVF